MTDTTELAPVTTEPAYGAASLERDAGYVPMPDESKETPDELTKDEAAERLKELSGPESAIVTHTAGLPPNVTMTLDQAADALIDARGADKAQAEIDDSKAEQQKIDALRGENEAAKVAATKPATEEEEIERALKIPRVREAIEQRVTEAETQRAAYSESVQEIGKARIAALASDFPELMNLPLQQWKSALEVMAQREPARHQQAMSRIQAFAQVAAAAQQIAQQKTAREQTEFKAYAVKENARFTELTKGIPAREMAAIEAHVPKMLQEHGADVKQFLEAVSNQSTFPRATAEALLVKAARYDLITKAAKAMPTRNVPTVQKPGFAAPRVNRADVGLAQLSAKLSKSGSLKDAVALRLARSKRG
jgi:hypothetical protein